MHPWHDCYVDDALIATAFPVVIEIPKGSKNKYELDKLFEMPCSSTGSCAEAS